MKNEMTLLNEGVFPFFQGFAEVFEEWNKELQKQTEKDNYPPYNIYIETAQEDNPEENIQKGDQIHVIELTVAGFDPEQIKKDITFKNNILTVKGEKVETPENRHYIVKKLATRKFERNFNINFPVGKIDIEIVNGILRIKIYQENNQVKINFK